MKSLTLVLICLLLTVLPMYGDNGNYKKIPLAKADMGKVVDLAADSMVVIELPAVPSTGYQWQVVNPSRIKGIIKELKGSPQGEDQPEFRPIGKSMPGAPAMQVLRFVGEKAGTADVMLAYRRPWEGSHENSYKVTIRSRGKFTGQFTVAKKETPEATIQTDAHVAALPAHFDWREEGGVTPVKNQGSCGSCWAYGAVAAFEAKIKIKDGIERDLSEQYLVSCNDSGYSCAGGWWAHDYHWFNCIPSESGAGARYEAEFAYQASDVPCNGPHTPYEQLEGWEYTDDVPDSGTPTVNHAPTVAQIKEKIYYYGPVATEVCSATWGSYTGGVHTNNCTAGDHIVLITGWDDTEGCFYIKNSWGTGWGESGYMKLAYNTCLVGNNSTYLLYEKTNPRIIYRSQIFHEAKENDGGINNAIEARIEDSTPATQFSVTGGYMIQGTHYTVSNLPAGLTLSIQALNTTTANVTITGKANAHANANDVSNLTVTFQNAAFTGGNASAVEDSAFSQLQINFFDPYQIVYHDPADVTISPSNVWQFYWLEGSNYSYSFGLWWYDSSNEPDPNNNLCLKLETYTKPALSHGTVFPPDVKALNYGDVIGPNATTWANAGSYGDQHTLAGPAYHDWKGKTAYVGFQFNYNGYPVYGWFRIQVSADGTQGTLLDYAWNQDPTQTIRAGYTDNGPPPALAAEFTGNPTTVVQGSSVQFTDQSTGSPTTWQWTFDGGTPASSSDQNPNVTYSTPGTYQVSLTVSNGTDSSTKTKPGYITVTDTSTGNYCEISHGNPAGQYITRVRLGSIDNSSTYDSSGYSDYTNQSTAMVTGTGETITVTPHASWSDSRCAVYIDWNQDQDFEDSGEKVLDTSGTGPYNATITPPGSAVTGATRMRVVCRYGVATAPCGSEYFGEAEDYTVTVSGGGTSQEYCDISHGNPAGQYITRVQAGSIDNSSSYESNGYSDYTAQSTSMNVGTGYSITVTPHSSWANSRCAVYVDWNQDGDFVDAGEKVLEQNGTGPYGTTITPPSGAKNGAARMRVVCRYDVALSPCGNEYFGEAEDYTINVSGGI